MNLYFVIGLNKGTIIGSFSQKMALPQSSAVKMVWKVNDRLADEGLVKKEGPLHIVSVENEGLQTVLDVWLGTGSDF